MQVDTTPAFRDTPFSAFGCMVGLPAANICSHIPVGGSGVVVPAARPAKHAAAPRGTPHPPRVLCKHCHIPLIVNILQGLNFQRLRVFIPKMLFFGTLENIPSGTPTPHRLYTKHKIVYNFSAWAFVTSNGRGVRFHPPATARASDKGNGGGVSVVYPPIR